MDRLGRSVGAEFGGGGLGGWAWREESRGSVCVWVVACGRGLGCLDCAWTA